MDKKTEAILRKWYARLSFNAGFDDAFEALLAGVFTPPSVPAAEYEFDVTPENAGTNFLVCLYYCEELARQYADKAIPERVLMDSLRDLTLWADVHRELTGQLGMAELHWIKNTLSFRLFRLGRLQFMPGACPVAIPAMGVAKGEGVLEIHIPRGEPLLPEECERSLALAKDFFSRYFPEKECRGFTCYSWLLDPTLSRFLSEDARILQFQKRFFPVYQEQSDDILRFTMRWDVNRSHLAAYIPQNRFTRAVWDYAMAGGTFAAGFGYIPL